jgi:iron(III) transport system ATP-binding protein
MTELWKLESVSLDKRVRDVSLSITTGVTAVLGHSGAGKTSLLNLLVGFEKPTAGTIYGRPATFWVAQDFGLWPHLTAAEHLQAVNYQKADLLDEFDLRDRADALPHRLSQGERSRLSVARALATEATVLVLDEPLAHVDPARVGKYWEVIRRRAKSLVFATHSPRAVLAEAKQVICLQEGRVIYSGEVEELYWRPTTPELAACFGEANWLGPDESRLWLRREESAARCYRPEQIELETAPESPLVVESARFEGAVAEVELRHESNGKRRRFWHRPSGNHLAKGTRVVLKALLMVMLCIGCGGTSSTTLLPVREVHTWPVPSEGTKLPAVRSLGVGNQGEILVGLWVRWHVAKTMEHAGFVHRETGGRVRPHERRSGGE